MAALLTWLPGKLVGEQGFQAVQWLLGGRVNNWQLQDHVLLSQFWVLVATTGILILDLNPNLQYVHELVP